MKFLRCVISEKRPFTAIILWRKENTEAFEQSAWISISTYFWMKRPEKGYVAAGAELLFVEKRVLVAGNVVERKPNRLLGDPRVSLVENAVVAMREVMAAEVDEVEADHRETVAFVVVLHHKRGKHAQREAPIAVFPLASTSSPRWSCRG